MNHPDRPDWACLRCGSDECIPDVRLIEEGESSKKPTHLGLQRRPDAVLFKGEVAVATRAAVCGRCGFVELEAVDPDALWSAHVDRESRGIGGA